VFQHVDNALQQKLHLLCEDDRIAERLNQVLSKSPELFQHLLTVYMAVNHSKPITGEDVINAGMLHHEL
jgi:hypothetical protein